MRVLLRCSMCSDLVAINVAYLSRRNFHPAVHRRLLLLLIQLGLVSFLGTTAYHSQFNEITSFFDNQLLPPIHSENKKLYRYSSYYSPTFFQFLPL